MPGATQTAADEINNRGEIVGHFADANDAQHAYKLRAGVVTCWTIRTRRTLRT